jgi:hypothetical protein
MAVSLATIAQLREQIRVDEIVDHGNAARRELLDQPGEAVYRRAGAADRRDAWPAAALLALGRAWRRSPWPCGVFGAGLFAGHNMVPRHCGEPQRQA